MGASWISTHLWIVPLLPLMAAVILFFCPNPTEDSRKYRQGIHIFALACMGSAFIFSLAALIQTLDPSFGGVTREYVNFNWGYMGDNAFRLGLLLDPLSAIMLTLFTLTGSCVFIFNLAYLKEKENLAKLYCRMMFFLSASFTIILSNSLFLFVVCGGWICVGTYLLMGYNYAKNTALDTGKQAFIFNSIGDSCFIAGMCWLQKYSSTMLLYDGGNGCIEASVLSALGHPLFSSSLTAGAGIAVLFLIGAMAKSALFPLHIWMPDTSEASWPAVTLIHLFSSSIAGIFVLIRLAPLLQTAISDPGSGTFTTYLILSVGILTLLAGVMLASVQNDVFRMLSCVTISQYGMILLVLCLGGITSAVVIFVLTILFRMVLYLGAGSLIHGIENGDGDIRKMGGLREYMPWTFYIFTGGSIGASLIPALIFCYPTQWGNVSPLLLGILFLLGLPGMVFLGFSQGRQIHYIFRGKYRMPILKIKENKLDKLKAALNAPDEPNAPDSPESHDEAGWWSVGSTIHLKQNKKTPKEPVKTNAPQESSVLIKSVMTVMAGIAILWLLVSLFTSCAFIGESLSGYSISGLLLSCVTLTAIIAGWECARRLYWDHKPKKIRSADPLSEKLPKKFYHLLKHDLMIDDFYRVTIQKTNRLLAKRANKFEEQVFQNTGFFCVNSIRITAMFFSFIDEYILGKISIHSFKLTHRIKTALPGKNKSLSLGILVFIVLAIVLLTLNYFYRK